MAKKKTVVMIVGSLRANSFNRQIAAYLTERLEPHVEVLELDYKQVPIFNQDFEFPAPAAVTAVRQQVQRADALWVVTPEYNHALPGGLKNVFDWLSRSVEPGLSGVPAFLAHKPVLVSGVGGRNATKYARQALSQLLKVLKLKEIVPSVGLSLPPETFITGDYVLPLEQKEALNDQVGELLAALKVVRKGNLR